MLSHRLHRTIAAAVLTLAVSAAAGAQRSGRARPRDQAPRANAPVTGVLAAVNPGEGTITVERIGADVDEVLAEKLKEGEKRDADAKADEDDDAKDDANGDRGKEADGKAAAGESTVFSLSAKAKIYIKFRSSPSVANNAERTPEDLRPMVGWPVSVKVRVKAEQPVAYEVVAWRGTPWKVK